MVRCQLCEQRRPNLKKMYRHSMFAHSKTQIVGDLLRSRLLLGTSNIKRRKPQKKPTVTETKKSDTDTLLTSNSLKIMVEREEVVLTDCKHEVRYSVPLKFGKPREDETFQACHLAISPLPKAEQPSEEIGDFYVCSCRKAPAKERKKRHTTITSDTESCSDSEAKVCCLKCGNGYRTHDALVEHLYHHLQVTADATKMTKVPVVKIYACPTCKQQFDSEVPLYQHIRWHDEENSVLNDVLDMKQEYSENYDGIPDINKGANMNDILNYLADINI